MTTVVIRVSQALMHAAMLCPGSECGLHCRCVAWLPGELARFQCLGCRTVYTLALIGHPIVSIERDVQPIEAVAAG